MLYSLSFAEREYPPAKQPFIVLILTFRYEIFLGAELRFFTYRMRDENVKLILAI